MTRISIFKISLLIAFCLGYCGTSIYLFEKLENTRSYRFVNQPNYLSQKEKLQSCHNELQITKKAIVYEEQYNSLVKVFDCLNKLESSNIVLNMREDINVKAELTKIIFPQQIIEPLPMETLKRRIIEIIEKLEIAVNSSKKVDRVKVGRQIKNSIEVIDSNILSFVKLRKNMILDVLIVSLLYYLWLISISYIIISFIQILIEMFKIFINLALLLLTK